MGLVKEMNGWLISSIISLASTLKYYNTMSAFLGRKYRPFKCGTVCLLGYCLV
ncbi:MAG: hypothetical protein QW803_03775 [Candidatus Methanomethylicia archaeon]